MRVNFPGYIEPGDVQNTITTMFGGIMHENPRNDSTKLWSPDPESFLGLRKRKSHCAPEYALRAPSPLSNRINHSLTLMAPLSAPPQHFL